MSESSKRTITASDKIIPYGKSCIDDSDIEAVAKVLKSNVLTQGPEVDKFENAFAQYVGSSYATAVSNGTAALHLSAIALGVSKGQKIITTPITFAASANCIRYCEGEITFSDIDSSTYLLDPEKVEDILRHADKGSYTGLIPVDFAGRAVNLEDFRAIANKYDLWILEDSCHAPGGYFKDKDGKKQLCGNGQYADLAIFSLHPVKHIAAGEGGMITTNDKALHDRLRTLRTHGITKDPLEFTNSSTFACGTGKEETEFPSWYMEMQTLGFNYRLTDMQSALGLNQLKKAPAGLERRIKIAKNYHTQFEHEDYILGQSGDIEGHAYHLYIIEVEDRLGLYNYLRKNNIHTQIHYIPCHLMPYYRKLGCNEGDLPNAENYYKRCISLPIYPSLSELDQEFVINKIKDYFSSETKTTLK